MTETNHKVIQLYINIYPFFRFFSIVGYYKKLTVPCARQWVIVVDFVSAAAAAKSRQSCPTLCDPIDGSPPGSPVSGILQARTLEWVAISFSNA